jgi:hypothetical protein
LAASDDEYVSVGAGQRARQRRSAVTVDIVCDKTCVPESQSELQDAGQPEGNKHNGVHRAADAADACSGLLGHGVTQQWHLCIAQRLHERPQRIRKVRFGHHCHCVSDTVTANPHPHPHPHPTPTFTSTCLIDIKGSTCPGIGHDVYHCDSACPLTVSRCPPPPGHPRTVTLYQPQSRLSQCELELCGR